MLTDCSTKARARRISALETLATQRMDTPASRTVSRRHLTATGVVFQTRRNKADYMPTF